MRDGGFGGSTAFVTMRRDASPGAALDEWTCDRRELFDSAGARVFPDQLGQCAGTGIDPCSALASSVTLAPGQTSECVILLGHAANVDAARALARSATSFAATSREVTADTHWKDLLGAVTVTTPDPLFDTLVNHWLLYQTIAW